MRDFVSPLQKFTEKNPVDRAMDLAGEAYTPGTIQQNDVQASPAFRNTGLGAFMAGLMPNTLGRVFDQQNNQALAEYAKHAPSDPVEIISGLMTTDPSNAGKYAPMLANYAAENNSPIGKTRAETAQIGLDTAKDERKNNKALQTYLQSIGGTQPTGSGPIGAEGNNLTNIRDNPANDWQGQVGANKGFAMFKTPEEGFRAAAKTLNSYAAQGVNDLDGVIQRWAPKTDGNDPEAYAEFVSKETGIPRNANINPADPFVQKSLLNAMQKMEVGADKAAPQGVVDAGVQMAHATQAPAPVAPQKSALQKYQDMAVQMGAIDPTHFADNALAAYAPTKTDEQTSEIKNYEFAKTHPDFATAKTLNGQMSAFADTSPFALARDSGVTGQQLIDTVPDKSVQNIAKQLLRGDMPFFQITSRTPAAQRAGMEVAQASDPSYSATTYPARLQNNKYFQPSGEGGKLISSIKAIGGHIETMKKLNGEMDNSFLQPWNYLANKGEVARDTPEGASINAYEESVNNIAPEMAKVIAGKTDVPLAEVDAQRKPFSSSLGPNSFEKATQTGAEMVAKRAQVMLDNWRSVMNDNSKPPAAQLDSATIETFKKLGVDLTEYFDTDEKKAPTTPTEKSIPPTDRARILELLNKQEAP